MTILPIEFQIPNDSVSPVATYPAAHGKTYDFDFVTGQLVESAGEVVVLTGTTAFKQALEKLLHTRRYAFDVYTPRFGSGVQAAVESAEAFAVPIAAAAETAAKETLQTHPAVRSVSDVTITLDSPTAPTTCQVEATVIDTFGASVLLDVTLSV